MKLLLYAGIIFFIGPIFLLKVAYLKLNVENNGELVKMRIEKLPGSCIGAKVAHSALFSYKGIMYEHNVRGGFCEMHYVGELIDMKWLEGSEYILFPHESALLNLISGYILILFGLFLIISQWLKIRKPQKNQ